MDIKHVIQYYMTETESKTGRDRDWASGCCSCVDGKCSHCCMAMICPLLAFSAELNLYDKMSEDTCCRSCRKPHDGLNYLYCPAWMCWITCLCFTGLPCILTCYLRESYRKNQNINGSLCNDCCMAFFCPCCDYAQVRHTQICIRALASVLLTCATTHR
jgi:Cys-rich protein (TIGR01571 family)